MQMSLVDSKSPISYLNCLTQGNRKIEDSKKTNDVAQGIFVAYKDFFCKSSHFFKYFK